MSEHDDDLESYVHVDEDEEQDTFPDTADELDAADDVEDDDDETLSDDDAEI